MVLQEKMKDHERSLPVRTCIECGVERNEVLSEQLVIFEG